VIDSALLVVERGKMAIDAILFDLDDTLIVDEAVSKEALVSTAELASKLAGIDSSTFLADAKKFGSGFWREGPCYDYVKSIGISFHECLWGRFEGEKPELVKLREWSRTYRVAVFGAVLRAQGVADEDSAEKLAAHFSAQRRQLARLMPDAIETLVRLKSTYKIALLTNGAPDLQREKIASSGLGGYFDAIAVSGEHGIGKPRAEIFHILLEELGVTPERSIMVGNSLERDIAGALNANLAAAVWLQVPGSEEHAAVKPHHTIRGLHEIPQLVEQL
jgi:putative hydrolase of the HAD superfamily